MTHKQGQTQQESVEESHLKWNWLLLLVVRSASEQGQRGQGQLILEQWHFLAGRYLLQGLQSLTHLPSFLLSSCRITATQLPPRGERAGLILISLVFLCSCVQPDLPGFGTISCRIHTARHHVAGSRASVALKDICVFSCHSRA